MDLSSIDALHPCFEATTGLLILELEHGKANEVGIAQLEAFEALCDLIESNDAIRTMCTLSRRQSRKGTPLFISGANVTERAGWDDAAVKAHVHRQRALMCRLRRLPVYNIALTHGVTLGWGTEYLLTTDLVLATPRASFALPETGLGIIPGARGSAELAAAIGPAAALLLGCTGARVDAVEAHSMGLVHEVHDDIDAGLVRVRALAEQVATRSPTAVAAFKSALLGSLGETESIRIKRESQGYELCVDAGEAALGREAFASIRAGERPVWGPRRVRSDT
jgi:enoyl-CoA hydratase/carnithine racemase